MSEESFYSCTTPAIEKIAADSLRRHSMRKSTSLNTREHAPHYLRASTGSCHDLCKYGKHVAEESQVPVEKKKKATLVTSKPKPNARTSVADPTTERVKVVKPLPISKALLSDDHEVPKLRARLPTDLQVSKLKTHVSYTSKAIKQDVPSSDRVCLSVKITTTKKLPKPVQSTDAAGSNRVAVKKIMRTPLSSPRPFLSSVASSKPRKQRSLKSVTPPHNEQVVLRHQEVEERKEAKGLLLNSVIEETASKLGWTHKSKVKALVSAFETVISLHDRKNTVN